MNSFDYSIFRVILTHPFLVKAKGIAGHYIQKEWNDREDLLTKLDNSVIRDASESR